MIKIGITGQNGFVGSHLANTLSLEPEKYQQISFKREFFGDNVRLEQFVTQCDVIVHLASLNRHNDPQTIYSTNVDLVNRLIQAMETTDARPHVLFASSIQEDRDNPYGNSKKQGRMLLYQWADRHQSRFTGLIITNVFGPFGHPYYNSVVATFCHQLTHNEVPKIDVDGELKLIYVSELVQAIIDHIEDRQTPAITHCHLPHTTTIKVSHLLDKLEKFKLLYFDKQIIPKIEDRFGQNLFNTFVCYIDHGTFYPGKLTPHTDSRGSFVEVLKLDGNGGQVSFSTTVPGVTRGDHFHTRKFERFAVISGKARIEIRRIGTNEKHTFELDGRSPAFVDMPIWYTHNITNIGNDDLYTLFWINEFYNPEDGDTYFEKV
ncbi:NAD-dependent epimerase/dehydratase family protein [Desulfobacter curvatus]|uniref:polysaccharide biosynthesis C-terminal domain-containing protein n=1 Tax=Desulfobacter curvatus TaxID=2290 RepID=UPI0003751336|nr:NAD-dependent epimerase/dehydratase family protein [Desulfobacter curvatus]